MARILMTADAVGGVWTYALELARALVAHGLQTTLATMGPLPHDEQIAAAAEVPGLELVTSGFRLEWMDRPWRDVAEAGEWLLDLEERVRPLLVHLNGYAHGALAWRAPVLVAGHSCVLSWHDEVGRDVESARLATYRRAATAGLRAADWVVAPTAAMLAMLQRRYGPLPRTSVVPNGRTADRLMPLRKEPFVFSAGRLWDPAKNIETLVAVAPQLSWPLFVAGDGRSGPPYIGRLSEAEMAGWLGRAAIFALPARYEPFGLLPLEAALCGCALVLGDIPSLREVWRDAAEFVDPGDRDALTAAVERLIASPSRLADRAAAARARARAFTPARMARRYLELYGCASSLTRSHPCAS